MHDFVVTLHLSNTGVELRGSINVTAVDHEDAQEQAIIACEKNGWVAGDVYNVVRLER